ncbi:hypothetical protein ACJX0J_029892 [Zea mays]
MQSKYVVEEDMVGGSRSIRVECHTNDVMVILYPFLDLGLSSDYLSQTYHYYVYDVGDILDISISSLISFEAYAVLRDDSSLLLKMFLVYKILNPYQIYLNFAQLDFFHTNNLLDGHIYFMILR